MRGYMISPMNYAEKKIPVLDPETLIQRSVGYNEVAIDPRRASIIGYFVATDSRGCEINGLAASIACKKSAEFGLPLREIVVRQAPSFQISAEKAPPFLDLDAYLNKL